MTVSGVTIGGVDAGNYTLTQPTALGNVTALGITGNFTAGNKAYDGTTAATVVYSRGLNS